MCLEQAPHDEQAACGPSAKLFGAFMLLQEKWMLAIVFALMEGPNGFNQLSRRASPVNITTLSQRLALLERVGLVTKTVHSMMPPRTTYELTEAGRALGPVIEAIGGWAERYLPDPPSEMGEHGACGE